MTSQVLVDNMSRIPSPSPVKTFLNSEPISGNDSHSNVVLQETDERSDISVSMSRDLGCWSITHPSFGCHAFVGTVFTNARLNLHPSVSVCSRQIWTL